MWVLRTTLVNCEGRKFVDAKYYRLRFYEALLSALIKSLEPLVAPEGGSQGLQPSVMRMWSCSWVGRRWEFTLDTASRDKDDGRGNSLIRHVKSAHYVLGMDRLTS